LCGTATHFNKSDDLNTWHVLRAECNDFDVNPGAVICNTRQAQLTECLVGEEEEIL
jgi:hypothetical protein